MKQFASLLALGVLAAGLCIAGVQSQTKLSTSIDRLKALAGEWTATTAEGETFTNKIRLVSNGTAIEESMQSSKDDQMVTMYTADGSRVVLTHYCSMGNQPRMETPASSKDTAIFEFSFTGATNLANAADPHMHHMILRIADNNHFSETWTMQANGKDTNETFHFTRKS